MTDASQALAPTATLWQAIRSITKLSPRSFHWRKSRESRPCNCESCWAKSASDGSHGKRSNGRHDGRSGTESKGFSGHSLQVAWLLQARKILPPDHSVRGSAWDSV